MVYDLFETQRALMRPLADFAEAAARFYANPVWPAVPNSITQRVSASYDLMHRLIKDYEKPQFGINAVTIQGKTVAVQERVVMEKPFCRLLRFKRFSDDVSLLGKLKDDPTVLIVAPLSGHHATLLRDTVRTMLQDHKVFITDWTDARMVPTEKGVFSLDDYVAYIREFITAIGPDVHVMSVCQPTVPVLGAISLMASAGEIAPRSMIMMGGPIDARKSPTAVNNLAMNKSYEWFENNVIYRVPANYPGAGRRVYPGFLQHSGFVAMNPDRHLTSHYDYFLNLIRGDNDDAEAHRRFYDEYNAVLDMDAAYYLDTIRVVFQDFALVNGTWRVGGELVRPQDIRRTALLTIEGELDDISGAGQTEAAHGLCSGIAAASRQHYVALGAGHYGIFSGRRWREKVYPVVRDFIAAHPRGAVGSTSRKTTRPQAGSSQPADSSSPAESDAAR